MERHDKVAMIGFDGMWSDVGSWNAIAELTAPDASGNRIDGDGLAIDSTGTFIHAPHRPVVALGVHDLLIIDTPDALLVAAKWRRGAGQDRGVAARVEKHSRSGQPSKGGTAVGLVRHASSRATGSRSSAFRSSRARRSACRSTIIGPNTGWWFEARPKSHGAAKCS